MIAEIVKFTEKELCTEPGENQYYVDKSTLVHYLFMKLNRPIRVCGMVRNEGEPGGGPFWARNADGTVSLQIVENSQIDYNDSGQKKIAHDSTHFNPVDLVCGVRNFKGEKIRPDEVTEILKQVLFPQNRKTVESSKRLNYLVCGMVLWQIGSRCLLKFLLSPSIL